MIIENTQGITQIVYKTKTHNFCPIGKDWYTGNITVTIKPGKQIPDYIELDAFVKESIEGKEMIIENTINTLYEHITAKYTPKHLIITNEVADATHSTVIVTKEGGENE